MSAAESIIKTLVFFDLFKHPLTNFELHKWLYSPDKAELERVLEEAERLEPLVRREGGFFFLPRSGEAVQKRRSRAIANDEKIEIARKAARLIGWVPFVKLAAVCNTLSFGAAEENSDIDFFIVARKGRIWTVRFLITAVLFFFGLRRHGRKIRNRICLSFYLTNDNLDLRPVALPFLRRGGESIPDIYLIYWITQLVPLINRDRILEKFWQANFWVKDYLANFDFESQLPDYRQIKAAGWVECWRRGRERLTAGRLGDWREKVLRRFQLKKMAKGGKNRQLENGTAVVVSDKILKFHEEDRREEYREEWAGRLAGARSEPPQESRIRTHTEFRRKNLS